MVQLHRGRPNPMPAELRFLKPLGEQTYPCAIKPNRLDPVRSFRTKYVERAIKWISAVPHQSHQAGRPLAEVNRHARYINLHAGISLDKSPGDSLLFEQSALRGI
jgi:hypothetical protein